MIKFFRHIRKSLLMENKTGKYFKYAIGEVILVIVGILIALQINNWNQVRNTKSKTDNYLKALITEIDENIKTLGYEIKSIHSDIEQSANSLKKLNIPEAKNYPDSIIRSVMDTGPIYKTPLSKTTFNDLINAGVLENVKDVDLKNSILSIESRIEICYETSQKAEDAWDNYQLPYLLKNNNVTDNWDAIRGIKLYDLPFKIKRNAFIYNFDYANILGLRMRMMGNYEGQLEYTKKTFIEISNKIKKHLKK